MPGQGPRLAPRHTRETYEAKCERHQEARESRRWRPNMTTCRLAQQASRAWYREQLKGARQHQLFCRRRLDQPEAVTDYRQGIHENMSLQEQVSVSGKAGPPGRRLRPPYKAPYKVCLGAAECGHAAGAPMAPSCLPAPAL